jgi:hypothetical protein
MRSNFRREIYYYENYYENFFAELSQKTRLKFNWTLNLLATMEWVPEKYFSLPERIAGVVRNTGGRIIQYLPGVLFFR